LETINALEALHQPSRETILKLQAEMAKLPQIALDTQHFFVKGMYARQIIIPAGTTLIGKVHKSEHFFMLLKGDMTLWTEEGMRRVQAPYVACAKPGIKRVGFAHEDSVCINVHATDSTDLAVVEDELVEKEELSMIDVHKEALECHS
jgi:hypothetical protein